MDLHQLLKTLRLDSQTSVSHVINGTGIGRTTLFQIETKQSDPKAATVSTLLQLYTGLGLVDLIHKGLKPRTDEMGLKAKIEELERACSLLQTAFMQMEAAFMAAQEDSLPFYERKRLHDAAMARFNKASRPL